MNRNLELLICDDDQDFHLSVKHALKSKCSCRSARHTDEALAIIRNHAIDIVLLDVEMRTPDEGLNAIKLLKDADPSISIIMSSGRTDFSTVRDSMRFGAVDYAPKGADPESLWHIILRVAEQRDLLQKSEQKDFEVRTHQRQQTLVGQSSQMVALRKLIEKIKTSSANVVIHGETGTGKEVVARLLRTNLLDGTLAPFIAIDSSTILSTTAESTLFGYERGAFTGAEKATKGIFEEANEGIVYFDEIANMPLEIQAKLLRVIQEKEFSRLGSPRVIRSNFRVICATNLDLEKLSLQGKFKGDLLQRLNVLPIEVPPLRDRAEDIPLLALHFLEKHPRKGIQFADETLEALKEYRWPGNIRELSNVIAYLTTVTESNEITVADLPPKLREALRSYSTQQNGDSFYDRVAQFEKEILVQEYERNSGSVSRLAISLGMDRSHLYTKLKEFKIHPGARKNES